MKKLLSLAIFAAIFSFPASAQHLASALGPNGFGYVPGGTNQGGGGAPGPVQFHTLPVIPATQFNAVDVSGETQDFVPSSWTEFHRGLARGIAELNAEQKTLGQIAVENRQITKPRARLKIIQDGSGKAIIQRQ